MIEAGNQSPVSEGGQTQIKASNQAPISGGPADGAAARKVLAATLSFAPGAVAWRLGTTARGARV